MEINSELIKELRASKAWTQQHLADACDVHLRTIQRVEREGSASAETVLALCAVFEIQRQQLSIIPKVTPEQLQTVQPRGLVFVASCSMVIGIFLGGMLMYFYARVG
jgi:DNA-binding XRE family transcriptional regulator